MSATSVLDAQSSSYTGYSLLPQTLECPYDKAAPTLTNAYYDIYRSHATLLDLSEMSRVPSRIGMSTYSSSGAPPPDRGSFEARSGLKIAHTASMKRAVLVPDDCPSPHPVPDLSSLLTLRKVAAEQLQQQQKQEQQAVASYATDTPAAAAGNSGAPGSPEGTPAAKPRPPAAARTSVGSRRTVSTSTHGPRRLSGGFDLDCGLAAALYARLVLHKWKWAGSLLVHVSCRRKSTAPCMHKPCCYLAVVLHCAAEGHQPRV